MSEYKESLGEKQQTIDKVRENDTEKPEETTKLEILINEIVESTKVDETIEMLQKLASEFTDNYSIIKMFYDKKGEASFIDYLIEIIHSSDQRMAFIPAIFEILAKVADFDKNEIKKYFIERLPVEFFDELFGISSRNPKASDYEPFVKENSSIVVPILKFLSSLSRPLDQEDDEASENPAFFFYWNNFNPLFDCMFSVINDAFCNSLVFKTMHNLLISNFNLVNAYENFGFCGFAFGRIQEEDETDFAAACSFLGEMVNFPFSMESSIPKNWIEIIGDVLLSEKTALYNPVLKMLVKFTSSLVVCDKLSESAFQNVIIEFSQDAPYDCRKNALEALMEIMTNGGDKFEKFVEFILEMGNLDFFVPFLETEDPAVMKIVVNSLIPIVSMAKVTKESGATPLFEAIASDEEVISMIRDITELDEDTNDPALIEAASYIITEIDGDIEKLESLSK